ncbi:unnamed protein product [Rotaria magnacalcarata]|uniref:Reverse transcriptase domain-containing protein n=1 Tax=Rotaria magnacalcarata TaxID=392030 RepID=A0A816NDM5_9BILA|nr:unnamed protein product [Rotaria magnacalcarata]
MLTMACFNMDAYLQWIYMNYNPFIILIIFTVVLSLWSNFYYIHKIKSLTQKLNKEFFKNNEIKQNKITLSDFMPFKPYQSFYINQATSPITLDELIIEAKRTYKFTIYPYDDMLLDMHYLQIELVQESSSIIILIEFFSGYNVLFPQIEELFSIVFHASKMIQIWGELSSYRVEYLFYHNHNEDDTIKSHIVNIQPAFKRWYNSTFVHNANCGQLLDFSNTDGPLCSCSHRPYKCRNDEWSIEDAIAYTFYEILDDNKIYDPHRWANQYNNGANQYNNEANPYNNRAYQYNNGANQYNNRYNNGANPYNNRAYQYNNNGANQHYNNRANQYYNRANQYYNRGNPYYRRNIYYNRNYRPQQRYANPYDANRSQGRFIRPTRSRANSNQQRRSRSNRPNSHNNRQRSQSRQRRRGPRQLHLNDFMPAELREPSPNLPTEFNIAAAAATTITAATTVPPDALPQRETFTRRNTTQPFVVDQNDQNGQDNQQPQPQRQRQRQQNQQQQRPTASPYRRRPKSRNNRFAELADENDNNNDNDLIEIEVNNEPRSSNINMKNNKKDKNTKKKRLYLEPNRILAWLEKHSPMSKKAISGRGNQAYALASAPIYDEWVRNNYEIQVWQSYLKLATEKKHWAKEVIQRTKRRDNVINTRFIHKKINRLNTNISEANTTISDLQTELSTYWMQTTSEVANQRLAKQITDLVVKRLSTNQTRQATVATDTEDDAPAPTASTITTTTTAAIKNHIREPVDRIEKYILDYIHFCTQHVKKMAQTRIQLAKAQMDEFKALEDFEQITTPAQWNIHLILKPKIKLWSTKNKNYKLLTKRVELELLPKIIDKVDFSFRVDESIINQDEAQATYDQMRQITKEFRTQAMKLYVQSAARENEILSNEINGIIEKFPKKENENDKDNDGTNAEEGYAAFEEYHRLREQRLKLEIEQSLYFLAEQRVEDNNNNQEEEEIIAPTLLTEQEHHLLRLGPRFIFDDPKTAARRRTTELATLKRKIETRFFEKKVSPGRPVEQFIAELDVLLQNLHNLPTTKKRIQFNRIQTNKSFDNLSSIIQSSQSSQSQTIIRPRKKNNYGRIVKRLKYKIHLANTILRKTDKSKVFHLGKVDHYQKKSEEYMDSTKAYQCLGTIDPLPDLIQRTNKYLLDLRLAKWITQKQYEQLSIKPNEVELAHLYYLPKAHKPGTPLRPIISGLKHPTIKISKFLDDLLRPLFDQMALNYTVTSGFDLVKQLQQWSRNNFRQDTIFCTIDVTDLYTMVPQIEGVLSLRKMLDQLKLKQVGKLKVETIIRLSRFVM